MKKRTFLKPAGGRSIDASGSGVPLDYELLSNRNQNRSSVACRNGIVCSSQPLASIAGLDILKAGGNAVDAAICANAMLALVEPMSCGPGGDLFAIVWDAKEQKLFGLNASGRAPYDWNIKKAHELGLQEIPDRGPLSFSVPGCVSGWDALKKRFGRLDLAKSLEAPIRYALEGFPVSPVIARAWLFNSSDDPGLIKTYVPDGTPMRFGNIFRNPGLAEFFQTIARDGADVFYKGRIAEGIVDFSRAKGGYFSMRDFQDHTVDWVEPVSTNYRGYDVWELPPNGQGIAALQILNLLEHFDIGSMEPNSAEHLHLFIEAKKLAFEDRAMYYADMDFADVPVKELISKEYASCRVKLINSCRAAERVAPGRPRNVSDTVYLTTADGDGNMVSLIQSNYHSFGSRLVPEGMGFCLQNRGQLFSLDPNDANCLQPHKRPFHTIIPAFITKDGKPVFSFGVMGGDFQPQGHAQVLMNIIDFEMSPQQAGDQPRVMHIESSTPTGMRAVSGGAVVFERGFDDTTKDNLSRMGHRIEKDTGVHGGYQGIWREDNPLRYFGGSDPRKDGCSIGY